MTPLVERILSRCRDTEEGCLEFRLAANPQGGLYISWEGQRLNVRRAMYEHAHGAIPAGKMVTWSCGNPKCLRHQKAITVAQRNKATAKAGKFGTAAARAKTAATRRKNSSLSDEAVREIRAHTGRVDEIAARHGISAAYAYMLRRNEFRREFGNPFAGLMR